MKIATACRNAAVDGIVDQVDAGSGAGYIQFRTGSPPTNVSDADSGTLLATCTMSDPAFGSGGASVAGRADASSITSDTSVDANGTAGHFRIKDSDGNTKMQGTVGTSGSDINFDSVTWSAGGTVSVTSLQITVPIGS